MSGRLAPTWTLLVKASSPGPLFDVASLIGAFRDSRDVENGCEASWSFEHAIRACEAAETIVGAANRVLTEEVLGDGTRIWNLTIFSTDDLISVEVISPIEGR